ncbi:MAG: 2-amino-4-hydroxy-6-hydroxymethyldihydropteridine diphosphokinase [Rhodocyclaceae bacterium]|nr:2-amino-4-hydroxy-6-hydroxymethyldihydropteridine diphosphokinase [Rhodocyclaceae bacterium]MBP6279892.1 2-amino-4-hydroxy-6-hydroxymethyldihydropteridine diphosphokinase [Rhodocyclaceae bacterium]
MRCYVALGANLGDPVATVHAAIEALRELPNTHLVGASSLYRTAPVGLKHQPDFINAVVTIDAVSPAPTDPMAGANALMHSLFRIEEKFGRRREPSGARNLARTLDLDLLLYADEISDDINLTLPHPRMHERAFVLAPLAEIAPDLVIPNRGTVRELLAKCADQRIERLPN